MSSSPSERALVIVLRLTGLLSASAVFAAFLPFEWMAAIHEWLALGQLPEAPIVEYLTRSLSALYAFHGALTVFVSFDVRRFLPVVRCLGVLAVVFGGGMLALDGRVGMPLFWTIGEGPMLIALGALVLWLAGGVSAEP